MPHCKGIAWSEVSVGASWKEMGIDRGNAGRLGVLRFSALFWGIQMSLFQISGSLSFSIIALIFTWEIVNL